jgi:hypothetical protein
MNNPWHVTPDRRTVLRTTAGAIGGTIGAGIAGASQHDIDINFSDEDGAPGENTSVSFNLIPANDPDAEVGAYDVKITYNSSILNFLVVSQSPLEFSSN